MTSPTTSSLQQPTDLPIDLPTEELVGEAAVLAAGVLCWRPGPDGLQVMLVHRPRYDDWSFPKGTLKPDESLPEAAVRELAEETGVQATLGRPLPGTRYLLPGRTDGAPDLEPVVKQVSYWAAQARRQGPRTASLREVDDARWVTLAQARTLLSHAADQQPLEALTALAAQGTLATTPLLVVRHATAKPRDAWPRSDAERPLVASGRRQAQALAGLLRCWRPEHALCSPWLRCTATLDPFVAAAGLRVSTKSGLSEAGWRRRPGKAAEHTRRLLGTGHAALLCTHRPVLATVLEAVRAAADPEVGALIPDDDPYLAPAEVLVAHTVAGSHGGPGAHGPRVVAVERHRG